MATNTKPPQATKESSFRESDSSKFKSANPTSMNPFMEKAPSDIDARKRKLERPSTGSTTLDRIISGNVYTPPEESRSLTETEERPEENPN